MDYKEMADKLTSLAHLDIDAVHAYDQAIEKIDDFGIRDTLRTFRNDHQRHAIQLSEMIRELGEEPPKDSPDMKGYFLEGFTALRSVTGTEGALKAMQSNEKLTNKKYDEARSWDLVSHAKAIVERNYEDERRHLEYIQGALSRIGKK